MDRRLNAGATLVLGGARSGKSRLGEALIEASGLAPVYIATGQAGDAEMAERIALHRQRRGPAWQTVEAPLALAGALHQCDRPANAILVDCLTLWISNLMATERDVELASDELAATVTAMTAPVVLVANEVGLGIVPDNALARRFRDEAGRLNQKIAAVARTVYFVAAGLPMVLKQESP